MDAKDVSKLESMPTKKQLIGKIAGSIKQITTKIPLGLKQVTAKVAYGARVSPETTHDSLTARRLRQDRVPAARFAFVSS